MAQQENSHRTRSDIHSTDRQQPRLGAGADNSRHSNSPSEQYKMVTHPRATLTVTEAAEILGISRSSAYELVNTGDIPALRLGRRIVVPRAALDALLETAQNSDSPWGLE